MGNGWTGGQHSVFRAAFALFLAAHFSREGTPAGVAGAALCIPFLLGLADRVAAALLIGALGFGADLDRVLPLLAPLAVHLFLPAAPFGSWAARDRVDPGAGWHRESVLHAAVWLFLALSLLRRPPVPLPAGRETILLLGGAALALGRSTRPWLWTGLLALATADAVVRRDPLPPMLPLLLFAFDPAWIPSKRAAGPERLFYDGTCGLCQASVRFVLAEAPADLPLRIAPLGGPTFLAALPEERRAGLPSSLVLLSGDRILVKSSGVLELLERIGGAWRILAWAARLVPRPVRDLVYDVVVALRRHVFRRPSEACPLLPPALRERFDP